MSVIPFNKPFLTGNELHYIKDAVESGKISGNGKYTQKCQQFFESHYGFKKCLLTTSCTDALEMAAILINIKEGDEVIIPSYTFVSTANPFILRGAKIVFADSHANHPGIDEDQIEKLITKKTKAIVPVHYAGFACDMDKIMALATKYKLFVIEDAAQAIDNYYISGLEKKSLGSIGHLATFSFHETKNIISGEGGLLVINDSSLIPRSEIIWEKGTNRSAFFKGEIDKYGWVDIGSSFLPSEIISSFLWAQIEKIESLQKNRIERWNLYQRNLESWAKENEIGLPFIPKFSTNNGHIFYLVLPDIKKRDELINKLKTHDIHSVFHYQSLHASDFFKANYAGEELIHAQRYSNCLMRLPLYQELTFEQINMICSLIVS